MRDKVLAAVVAAATFGLVNGAIVGVGLATSAPKADVYAITGPLKAAPPTVAAAAAPAAVFAR
jgi:hypothetical protein